MYTILLHFLRIKRAGRKLYNYTEKIHSLRFTLAMSVSQDSSILKNCLKKKNTYECIAIYFQSNRILITTRHSLKRNESSYKMFFFSRLSEVLDSHIL